MRFGARLAQNMKDFGPLSVGLDPSREVLAHWGLPDEPQGLVALGRAVIDAAHQSAAAIKPQVSFFERFGAAGIAALELVVKEARSAGLLVIIDAKRGDIGSTMAGYAEAYLVPGAPLECDALTVSPYLGLEALEPAFEAAAEHGKGLFVLALTSNPGGDVVQHSRDADGVAVATHVAARAAHANAGVTPMGDIGLVIGATTGPAVATLPVPVAAVNGPMLAPGVGAQGATAADLAAVFGDVRGQVLAHQSRGILMAGPVLEKMRSAIRSAADDVRLALGVS